jgi:hypothetical protein
MSHPLARGLNQLTTALTGLKIPFMVSGSLASITHGEIRYTQDGDLLAVIGPLQIPRLAEALGREWYFDLDLIRRSIEAGRGFNLIHMTTACKFDIFPASSDFHESQLRRAKPTQLRIEGANACPVATAEDILLSKLAWYREGGGVSEVQWRDIGGILVINPELDWDYVNHWAARLGVSDLLEKAKAEAQADL